MRRTRRHYGLTVIVIGSWLTGVGCRWVTPERMANTLREWDEQAQTGKVYSNSYECHVGEQDWDYICQVTMVPTADGLRHGGKFQERKLGLKLNRGSVISLLEGDPVYDRTYLPDEGPTRPARSCMLNVMRSTHALSPPTRRKQTRSERHTPRDRPRSPRAFRSAEPRHSSPDASARHRPVAISSLARRRRSPRHRWRPSRKVCTDTSTPISADWY